jgi:formylglycine-generating enzyme required for sulfatase activity/glucan phosphoethanolaminetransferase (alkaline phosphatase superfamily)
MSTRSVILCSHVRGALSAMKRLAQRLSDHITPAKAICLALLFTPLWGLWWQHPDAWVQDYWIFPLAITFLSDKSLAGFGYTFVCFFAFVSFVLLTFIRPAAVRVPLMVGMLIGWGFELFILDINGTLSSQNLLMTLWQERATGPDVVGGYATEILRNTAAVAILGMVLCAPPARCFSVSGIFGVLPIVSVVMVAGTIVHSKGDTQVFPIPFGAFANTAILGWSESDHASSVHPLSRNVAINRDVKVEGSVSPLFNKIVVIMDESVRGDYISLNDPAIKTTPFLSGTDNLINFGVAMAGANCSSNARMMFRFGMRQSDLPNGWDQAVRKPTFWQLAHGAGYKTVYIDAFAGPLEYHSGSSLVEKRLIDSKINILDSRAYLRDHKAVDKLVEVLKNEEPAFIYLDKFGVHSPYATKYPPDFRVFPTPAGSELADREVMVAHYRNAIAWSVDEFFKKLLPAVDLSKTLIIYTSDHGQSLLQGGYKQTHCSVGGNVHPGEAYVPLFAVTLEPEFKRRLANGAALGSGRFSHFEVFPTLLLAMGYDAGWVAKTYGPSLMETPAPDRKFLIGFPYLQPQMISEAERAWVLVKDTTSVSALEAFIRRFGDTPYGGVATARIEERKKPRIAAAKLETSELAGANATGKRGEDEARANAEVERKRLAILQRGDERKPAEAVGKRDDAVGSTLQPGSVFRDCPECPEMVALPAGDFIMGSPESEEGHQANEEPRRNVTIAKPFGVGKFEVTFAEWAACAADGGCASNKNPNDEGWGRGKRPVLWVSWDEAKEYVAWLSRKTGKTYRLLTEAEWEYGARGVTTASASHAPFSAGATISTDQANYDGNATYANGTRGVDRQKTVEVGSFPANAFGLHDMHGNVWEWVEDCYKDSYHGAPTDGSAVASTDCGLRVLRGGSWYGIPQGLRSAYRDGDRPDNRGNTSGFRVARTL